MPWLLCQLNGKNKVETDNNRGRVRERETVDRRAEQEGKEIG